MLDTISEFHGETFLNLDKVISTKRSGSQLVKNSPTSTLGLISMSPKVNSRPVELSNFEKHMVPNTSHILLVNGDRKPAMSPGKPNTPEHLKVKLKEGES